MASSKTASSMEALKNCQKLLAFLMQHKDAAPFLEPVNWKDWGLLDYPKVIKTPMDLGTVKAKLESGAYGLPREFRHDVNLVWTNCMTYNSDGSDFYLLAYNLKKVFEEKFAKMVREDDEPQDVARPPTLVDKKMFSQNIYNISAEDLGKVVQILDQRCESCIKKIDPEELEIDIDSIDAASFWVVDALTKDCLPGGKKQSKATKKAPGSAGPVGGGGAGAGSESKSKKAKI